MSEPTRLSHHAKLPRMSVALWIAAMPWPACWKRCSAAFSAAVHGSPEVWNITIASYCARFASVKTAESSLTSEVMPAAASAAWSFGVPCSMASVCLKAAVSLKIRT